MLPHFECAEKSGEATTATTLGIMQEEVKSGATAVGKYHSHSIPLDMEDIERDWDKPIADAGIAAKASVIVRVGMLDLGAGTGSFRVREMMHRIAYPLNVHVRADVNLTDIQATCTDGKDRKIGRAHV